MKTKRNMFANLGCLGLLFVSTSACSFSFGASKGESLQETAEELIAGELSDIAGFSEELDATCDKPADDIKIGDTFDCTGTSADGQVVEFTATHDKEDHVDVVSTNLVTKENFEKIVDQTEQMISKKAKVELPSGSITCEEGPLVGDEPLQVTCELTDPTNGQVFDLTLEVTDFEDGSFNYEIGNPSKN
jgi:hypothetical protein